tara:strand:+ start:176 stop:1288 length:1113 start_codon:yes stop_codon:yes gene_type:complete
MNNCFIILAAGESKRFNSNIPKPYYLYKEKPLLLHSFNKVISNRKIRKIIIVINKKHRNLVKKLKLKNAKIIIGGKTRAESAYIALKTIKNKKFNNVLIHDGARPDFSIQLLNNLLKELKKNDCVIPAIKINDSIKYKDKKLINLNRNKAYLTQTPQAFNYKKLFTLQNSIKANVTDDASLFINAGEKIKLIKGEKENIKITTKLDIKKNNLKLFYGIGFDIHRLIKKRKLYLGGQKIPYHSGLKGHSDGDVIIHAIIDSLLGAMRKNDIGTLFPNNKKFKNIRSAKMLKKILQILNKNNYYINNLDINLICERPKVSKYRKKIIYSLSKLLSLSKNLINLKGKTTEKLGLIGKEKAIACESIVSITNYA